jgi:hypothetical protein
VRVRQRRRRLVACASRRHKYGTRGDGMKSYDVVGYAVEADLLCVACAQRWAANAGLDLDDVDACEVNAVAPVFADECCEDLFCGACGYQIWEQGGDA